MHVASQGLNAYLFLLIFNDGDNACDQLDVNRDFPGQASVSRFDSSEKDFLTWAHCKLYGKLYAYQIKSQSHATFPAWQQL
jgi:hypothetical protein